MTEPYQPDPMKDLARFYDSRVILKGGQSIFAMRSSLARKGRLAGPQSVMVPIGHHLRNTRSGGYTIARNPRKRT